MTCRRQIEPYCLTASFTGSARVYPALDLVNWISFEKPYALVGLHFNTSLVAEEDFVSGAFLIANQQEPRLTLSDSIRAIAAHIQHRADGPGGGLLDDWISFGKNGIALPVGRRLSLYCCAGNGGVARVTSVASLQLVPIA